MKSMGLKKGSNVFIHSSYSQFYNFKGTIKEFIDTLLMEIGPDGTLAMPSYPSLNSKDDIFDIEKTPTGAGMISEIFRRYPGVKRSIDIRHPVCAIGPMTDYLLDEHKYSEVCFDAKSPYYKLSKINALVFSLGLGKIFMGTFSHCVEGILKDEYPYFSLFFQKKTIGQILLPDKSIYSKEYYPIDGGEFRYRSISRRKIIINKYFDKSKYKRTKISNLNINMFEADYATNRLIKLGRNGIVPYIRPKPIKSLFIRSQS